MRSTALVLWTTALLGCGASEDVLPAKTGKAAPSRSSTIAASPDGTRLWVVHPDADSVTSIDVVTRKIASETLLEGAPPALDPSTQRFYAKAAPRALALSPDGQRVYVTGQRSGAIYALDAKDGTLAGKSELCAEPIGVLASRDGARVFVACSQDDGIVEVDASTLATIASVATPRKPWALAFGGDVDTIVATHLLGPGVSVLGTKPLALSSTWALDELVLPKGSDPTSPQGQVRGVYDAAVRPRTSELWTAHLMLGTRTPQPTLGFLSTVFPSLSIFDVAKGKQSARLTVSTSPGDGGAFGDIVSGPRAVAFSDDGALAFVVDTDSEDVLVVDADKKVEVGLARPLPGHMPDGAQWLDGKLYVNERNTEDVVVLDVAREGPQIVVTVDGAPIPSLSADPMPAELRLGQKLFYSANSDDVATTQNHWVACASCHVEGRSDAVTWLFTSGPRDTPSNAGGTLDTGFLLRTADRTRVEDYWETIDLEQGGHFHLDEPSQKPLLNALASFVNHAMPAPAPPRTDASLVAKGAAIFQSSGCGTCHTGPAYTDSGAGNSSLDLGGAVLLHDVGTCVTKGFPDVAHSDQLGHPRAACAFDTPALRGLWDSAPYLHDGSAASLEDVLPKMLAASIAQDGKPPKLGADDQRALVEFLKSL